MVLKCLFQSLIASVSCQSLVGESNLALAVVNLNNFGFQLIADMYKELKL